VTDNGSYSLKKRTLAVLAPGRPIGLKPVVRHPQTRRRRARGATGPRGHVRHERPAFPSRLQSPLPEFAAEADQLLREHSWPVVVIAVPPEGGYIVYMNLPCSAATKEEVP
jgi:hypothetical protein